MGRLAVRAPPTRNRGRNRALRGRLRLPVSGSFDRRWVRRSPAHLLPPPADRTRSSRQHMRGHPVNAPTYPMNPAHGPHGEGARERGTGGERRGRVGVRSPAEGAHAHGVAEPGGLGAARLDPVAQLPGLGQLPQELRPPPSTRGIVLPPVALPPISRRSHLFGCPCCCFAGGSRRVFGRPCCSARRPRRVFGFSPQRPAGCPCRPTGRLRCPVTGARRPAARLRRTACRPGRPATRTCRPVGLPRRPAARAGRLVGRVSTLGRRSLVGGRFPVGRPVGAP